MNGMMSVGRSKAKQFNQDRPKTTFADVAGYFGVKQEISEVVEFLKTPAATRTSARLIPKGILLVGPPGTGKTMLARAVAGEAGVPFFSVSGSDFMEMFVGVGASRVRDLFATARKQSPAIVFIDEIDSIGRKRGAGLGGGHDEREQTLNQMLNEMDGFDPTEGVVVIAATNRPDVLDPALLRPGRFDRQIVVPLPDLDERLPDPRRSTRRTNPSTRRSTWRWSRAGRPGMSGADLANLVNESALHAVRRHSPTIGMEDFESARDRVIMGQQRDTMVLMDDERERIAFHESGHALLAYVLDKTDPLHKITIIPRGHGAGRHDDPARRGPPHHGAPAPRGLAVHAHGRTRRRTPRLRRPLDGRRRRPAAQHRTRAADGSRVGHVQGDRTDGLGLEQPGLPGRGPHAHARLLGPHLPDHRRRGRADPARARGRAPSRC